MVGEDKEGFAIALIKFYKDFIVGNSSSIKQLAEIQDKFPDAYSLMLQLKDDPSVIEDSKLLGENEKTTILVIILKASKLAGKSQRLFDLSAEEKRALAKELEEFASFVEQKLIELVPKK